MVDDFFIFSCRRIFKYDYNCDRTGRKLSSELTVDEMWQVMQEYGIDRQLLEATNPSKELLFRLYSAIKQVKEKSELLEQENDEFFKVNTIQ